MFDRDESTALVKRALAHLESRTTDQAESTMSVPVSEFIDPHLWRTEMDVLFKRRPLALAFTPELREGGDYKAMEVAGVPVLIVRGYELRRTDAFNLQSEAQKRVFDHVLENDIEGAVKLAKELVNEIKAGRIPQDMEPEDGDPLEPLVISRTVAQDSKYVNPDSMSNVLAARKLKELGYEVVPGMKVSWIVVDARKSPMHVEPWMSGRVFEFKADWEYYARRVAQTLAYVTEVYGWDERALLMGTVQADLFHEGFEAEDKPKKIELQKTKKELTLEDFL